MVEKENSQIQYDRFGVAAEHGDLQTIQSMLTTSDNPVPVDCLGRIVKINLVDDDDECLPTTALVRACQGGHCNIVQELLRAGADVNWKKKTERVVTPLYAACRYGNRPEVVEALLAAGADVNATVSNDYGYESTPLMSLASSGGPITSRIEIARLLLAANCDINQETKDGRTALERACSWLSHDSIEYVRFLLEHGARVTPNASFACFYKHDPRFTTVKISCLLEHGMDVNATTTGGSTAIHWAAEKGNTDLVRLLLDHNADVSIQNHYGRTALMELSVRILPDNEIPIFGMLLERMIAVDKKLIDLQDADGYTALHFAAKSSERVIYELLNCAPNLHCHTRRFSSTALHCALGVRDEERRMSNIQCLVEHANGYAVHGINIQDTRERTVLHLALEEADIYKSVINYLSTIVNISIQDVEGNTVLHKAVMCKDSDVIIPMLLRSRHATEAANTRNDRGRTPLHEAVLFLKNANLVQVIGRIADVNIRNHSGATALHLAVTARSTSCVDMLLMLNATVSMRDHDGNTALMLACNSCDDNESHSQLTMIFQLYKHAVAYGEVLNMIW